jgi:hypothetical protein
MTGNNGAANETENASIINLPLREAKTEHTEKAR